MSKTTLSSLASRIDCLQQTVAGLTELLAEARRQLEASAEREQTTALVIADLRHQLKASGDRQRAAEAPQVEAPPAADDLPPAWWQLAGLERFAPPAEDKVEVIANFGFMGNAVEPPNPYAQLIRSRSHGGRALAILKPDVAARMHAAGRFAIPPGVKHVCFCR
jgi:hypothetical protein